jgi:hypothetical protein
VRKLKAIWRILFSRAYVVYTSTCFGTGKYVYNCDYIDFEMLRDVCDVQIEADKGVEYVKTLIAEL